MKNLVVITRTEGGAERKDYTEADVAKMRNVNSPNYGSHIIGLFDALKVGQEATDEMLKGRGGYFWATWAFMTEV